MSNQVTTNTPEVADAFSAPSIPVGSTATVKAVKEPARKQAVKPPSDALAVQQAKQAFNENASGELLKGTAEQRISYAVAIHYSNMLAKRLNVPSLADCLSNKNDKSTIVGHMRADLLGDKPETKDLGDKETLAVNDAYRAKTALLDRGITIASIAARHKCDWQSFNTKANAWMIPARAFLDKGEKLGGHCTTNPALLIGSGILCYVVQTKSGEPKTLNRAASTAALLRYNALPTAKRAPSNPVSGGATFDPKKIDDVVSTVDLSTLIGAVHQNIVALAGKRTIRAVDLKGSVWNMLSDIWMRMDEAVASPHFGDKLDDKTAPKEALAFAKQYMAAQG